ncbi:hypothetical protein C7212DRAFT_301024 [Tuber magnatum]|uniref:Hydrophobin n=1 Tax=Tuber magnatum TaxID=42249 RepID=A0A317SFZ5_9PEZI|nr:hypothetical protein C7212DRAFT_301024 [Tuber magnatum]
MVSVKSLAVILFAAAVTAIPVAGGDNRGRDVKVHDKSQRCPDQSQQIFCCNDATDSKVTGAYTGVLDGVAVRCNTVPVNAVAVDVVSQAQQCSAKSACCNSETSQNGLVNIAFGCVAFAS